MMHGTTNIKYRTTVYCFKTPNYLEGKVGYVLLTQYCSGEKIEENEMGGECMGKRRGVYRVLVGDTRERDNLGDPRVDGRIILR